MLLLRSLVFGLTPLELRNGTDLINHESVTLWAHSGETYPNSCLGQVRPHGDLLPGRHVRVAIPAEGLLQFVQLLRGEVCPLAPLAFVLLVVLATSAASGALILATAVARYRRPRSVTAVVVGQATADVFRLHRGRIDTCDCGGKRGREKSIKTLSINSLGICLVVPGSQKVLPIASQIYIKLRFNHLPLFVEPLLH